MLDTFLQESPLYQEIIEKGEQTGMQRGEQIGLQRGEQIGLQRGEQIGLQRGEQIGELQALRVTIMRFVKKRFADLVNAAEVHLETINEPLKLQAIVDEIPYAPDEAAARALLGLPA